MNERAVLFMDDDPSELPTPDDMKDLRVRFGLCSVCVDPQNPVASGLRLVDERPEIVAVLTDTFPQHDFSHVAELRTARPDLLIAIYSGHHFTPDEKARAMAAGADACFEKGESLDTFFESAADDYRAADRRLRLELPGLRCDPDRIGRWVAFSRCGMIAEGDDDLKLIQLCEQRFAPGQFVVARILPELSPLENAGSWHPLA